MTTQNPKSQPQLSATEQKLLRQVQENVKPQPSWVKFVTNSMLLFY